MLSAERLTLADPGDTVFQHRPEPATRICSALPGMTGSRAYQWFLSGYRTCHKNDYIIAGNL